jgi:hypothetical protein
VRMADPLKPATIETPKSNLHGYFIVAVLPKSDHDKLSVGILSVR